jgi:hypothetical protein
MKKVYSKISDREPGDIFNKEIVIRLVMENLKNRDMSG